MATVIDTKEEKAKRVKSLKWLTRHREEIESFTLFHYKDESADSLDYDGFLIAHLTNERVYIISFADFFFAKNLLFMNPRFERIPYKEVN
jgi:hypothetical protein